MSERTRIEWADSTASPWTGCTPVSAGCANCYARTLARRYGWSQEWGAGVPRHRFAGFERAVMAMERKAATGWFRECVQCGRRAFIRHDRNGKATNRCCGVDSFIARPRIFPSLCDWLDPEVPAEWLAYLLDVIRRTPHLDWLLLTKRPGRWMERMYAALGCACVETARLIHSWLDGAPPSNVWIGATAENQDAADERVPQLLRIPARVRFLSCEPMLGPVDVLRMPLICGYGYGWANPLQGVCPALSGGDRGPMIDLVICGFESGPLARPGHPDWARSLRDQCEAAGVAFKFKQWGSNPPPEAFESVLLDNAQMDKHNCGRMLDGREWNGVPLDSLRSPALGD